MSATASGDLVRSLRTRLSDDRATVTAFSISVVGNAKAAFLETETGHLSVTVEGGEDVQSFRWNLSSPQYSTLGKLINALQRLKGFSLAVDPSVRLNHPSATLGILGISDIKKSAVPVMHPMWSDDELIEFLSEAVQLHNPSLNVSSVPATERVYVLMKAQSLAYRALAGDTARRKGLDQDAKTLLALADSLDSEYRSATTKQNRSLQPVVSDESKVGSGDIMSGSMTRRSARSGYTAPFRNANPPTPPELYEPADDDVADVEVRLRWSQSRDYSFAHYELWRSMEPNVDRSVAGRLSTARTGSPTLPVQSQYSRVGTAKQVLGVSYGATSSVPVFDGFYFGTASEQPGSILTNSSFVDGVVFLGSGASVLGEPLEPETDYYYRLYAVNWNGEIVPSNVMRVRTRQLRARLLRNANKTLADTAMSVSSGPLAGGTSVTLLGTNFVIGMTVTFGGKPGTVTIVSATEATVVTPAYVNTDFIGKRMDVVVTTPGGLQDIILRGWAYT